MIAGATRGAGGPALGRHLANAGMNEAVIVGESRGLVSEGIRDQVAELTRLGSHARTQAPVYHVHADPPEGRPWDHADRARYWKLFEKEFGLEWQPFASVLHIKGGREHEHRAYLRTRPDGTAIRLDHDFARREKLSRIMEHERGEPFTRGAHNRAVITALKKDGREDVADAMRAAGLHEGPRARAAVTPTERAQQERTHVTKAAVAAAALAAWRQSDTGPALLHALAAQGLRLAAGDKPGMAVVLDGNGGAHSLARLLAQASKAEGGARLPAADVAARLDGVVLPNVAEARQATAAQPSPPPDDGPPSPGASPPPGGGQDAPGAADVAHAYIQASHGGDAPAPTAAQVAPGAALEDAGPGPGEPPGPGAHPDEVARHRAALAAHQDRKASAWVRWLAQQAAGPQAASRGGGHARHAEITYGRHGRAAEQAYSWIRGAQGGTTTRPDASPAAGAGPGTSEDGHDRSGGGDGAAARDDHTGDARADGTGVEPAARPGGAPAGRGAEPDYGNPVRPDGDAGKPAQDRAAAGGAAADARQAVARRAAEARLALGLAGQPDAMDKLRQARQELDPAWRAARDARRRIRDDQARIDAILSTHPHPDPASRDPAARATAYAHAISDRTRQRTATVDAAEAQAVAAVQGRSRTTRILAAIGIANAEQRQAESLVARAVALAADATEALPSRDDYTRARADSEAHAYAAQQTVAAWEARPEVAAAIEQHRLNQAVQQAVEAGDQAINAAVHAGDAAAARAIIRAREEQQERISASQVRWRPRAEQEWLEQLRRGTPGDDGLAQRSCDAEPRPPSPGNR